MKKRGIAATLLAVMVMVSGTTVQAETETIRWDRVTLPERPVPSSNEDALREANEAVIFPVAIMGNGKPKRAESYAESYGKSSVIPNSPPIETYDYTYDAQGNLIAVHNFQTNIEVVHDYNYEYDNEGRLIKKASRYSDNYRELYRETVYVYDNNGRLKMIQSDSNTFTEFYYNEQGKMIRSTHSKDGAIIGRIVEYDYSYDNEGRVVRKDEYELSPSNDRSPDSWRRSYLDVYEEYSYDEQGRLLTECRYWLGGGTVEKLFYSYNNEGYLTRITSEYASTIVDGSGSRSHIDYIY